MDVGFLAGLEDAKILVHAPEIGDHPGRPRVGPVLGPSQLDQRSPSGGPSGAVSTANILSQQSAVRAAGGLRFHDLRHSYATWLVSCGLPVNDVQRVMGHENASTTLELYTHQSGHADQRAPIC